MTIRADRCAVILTFTGRRTGTYESKIENIASNVNCAGLILKANGLRRPDCDITCDYPVDPLSCRCRRGDLSRGTRSAQDQCDTQNGSNYDDKNNNGNCD